MNTQMTKRVSEILGAAAIAAMPMVASAQLNLSDPSIINLYRLNEATSGQLNNSVTPQFYDTASPTPSVVQNHNDFNDGVSNGPQWGTGAAFMSGATTVGDGIGLTFTRSDNDHTRVQPLLGSAEGNYTNGKSFSLMFRVNAASLVDNNLYILGGHSSNYVALEGTSQGGRINTQIREGVGGGETVWQYNTTAPVAADSVYLATNTWYNIFMMYEANTSITLAVDDGTTFRYRQTTAVPASFNTLTNGYADPTISWGVATHSVGLTPVNPFDGKMESMVMWDKALTLAEADAIGLTNLVSVPRRF